MKLGIVVVYLVKQEDERLLDLHLDYIDKYTGVPYTIYGSVNRLLPQFRRKLEAKPRIKTFELDPPSEEKLQKSAYDPHSVEHVHFLDQLMQHALDDGVSHIAIMHVDSFPIRSGWVEEITSKLSKTCLLAAVLRDTYYDRKPMTAFILFHRDFYFQYKPTLLLPDDERTSPEYEKYKQEYPHIRDAGLGYGYRIYLEDLSWHPLERSNRGEDHYIIGSIYGDLIFHMGAASREKKFALGAHLTLFGRIRRHMSKLIPRRWINQVVQLTARNKIVFHDIQKNVNAYDRVKAKLLADPDAYLYYLRTGRRNG